MSRFFGLRSSLSSFVGMDLTDLCRGEIRVSRPAYVTTRFGTRFFRLIQGFNGDNYDFEAQGARHEDFPDAIDKVRLAPGQWRRRWSRDLDVNFIIFWILHSFGKPL